MKQLEKEIEKLNAAKQTFLTPITFFLEGDRFYVTRKDDVKNRSMVGSPKPCLINDPRNNSAVIDYMEDLLEALFEQLYKL